MPSTTIPRPGRPAHHASKKRPASPHAESSRLKATIPTAAAAPLPPVVKKSEALYYEDDYRSEVLAYMTMMDNSTLASADFMDMQPELQWFMRPYLVDFIIEVHGQFRLRPEVLYLAFNIVDRYVSKRIVYKKHYQLVGCSALWIAAKFEDGKDKVPLVRELADMCCKAYDESAFIQMEGHVLSTIGWNLGHPSAEAWLREFTMSPGTTTDDKLANVTRFLMEITLFHREFVGIQSAYLAAGAMMLAQHILKRPRDVASKYEMTAVRIATAIDRQLGDRLEEVSEIVVRKYAPTYYHRASTVVREWYLQGSRFTYAPASPITPSSSAPGLAPSGSWKRGSWMSASPSAGSISCSSSEAGDEPLTPVTPISEYPFHVASAASKENIPLYASSSASSDLSVHAAAPAPKGKVPGSMAYYDRPVLNPIPQQLSIPNRTIRRSSS